MKKTIALSAFILVLFCTTNAFSQFYMEVISNTSGSINFTVGVYVDAISYVDKSDGSGYSVLDMAIINDANANRLSWVDYKVFILLNDGTTLFNNYTTAATTGEYSCTYEVASGETRYQKLCFSKKFSETDIKNVWLSLADANYIDLMYSAK